MFGLNVVKSFFQIFEVDFNSRLWLYLFAWQTVLTNVQRKFSFFMSDRSSLFYTLQTYCVARAEWIWGTPQSKLLNSVPSNNFNRLFRYCRLSDFLPFFLCPSGTVLWVSGRKGLHSLLVVGRGVFGWQAQVIVLPSSSWEVDIPCPPSLWVSWWHPVLTSAVAVNLWSVH